MTDIAPPLDVDLVRQCEQFELNDAGNGRRLLTWFGDQILYVRGIGWAVWDGRRWAFDGGAEAVARMAQRTAELIHAEAGVIIATADDQRGRNDAEVEQLVLQRRCERNDHGTRSGNLGRLAGMIAAAASHRTVAPAECDAEPLAINVANGTLRVSADGVVWHDAHCREDRITKLMAVSYDADATCPRWGGFLERALPDPASRRWLQRWHGYALTGFGGDRPLAINHGLGANGKTTFLETIQEMMGDYAAGLTADALTAEQSRRPDQASPEWARLAGVRLLLIGELPASAALNEQAIRLVTGGDPMLVRHLNQDFFNLRPAFKAVMTGNHQPIVTGSNYAIWRWMRLIEWTGTLAAPERRPMAEILREFQDEAPGILNWLLEGLRDFLEHGVGSAEAMADVREVAA